MVAVAGIICTFLSFASIFILFLIGAFWMISAIRYKQIDYSWLFVLTGWLLSFGLLYFFIIKGHENELGMLRYWKDNFMPLNPFHSEFWNFIITRGNKVFVEIMIYNKGYISKGMYLFYNILLLILYFTGLISVVLRRNKKTFYFLFSPLLLHLFLSGLHKYPFETRVSLYLAPLFYMTISLALVHLLGLLRKLFHFKWPGVILICLILLIFPYKLFQFYPFEIEGARESIYFINDHYEEDQHVYVNPYARNIYRFYFKIGKVTWEKAAIDGAMNGPVGDKKGDPEKDVDMIKNMKGETWLLFSHLYPKVKKDHDMIMERLRETGNIRLEFRSRLSAAYLVNLEE
jgi:hypothetical protein